MNNRRTEDIVRWVLVILGVVTATPALVLAWPGTLEFSYGLGDPADPMVLALLKHRGVLQAALGGALIWAAFQPVARIPAALTAIVTKSAFLILIATMPGPARLDDVAGVLFDAVAVLILAVVVLRQVRLRHVTTEPLAVTHR